MDGLTILTATSYLADAFSEMGSGYAQSEALKSQGEIRKQMYDTNARLAKMQASDAIQRGEKAASKVRLGVRKMKGTQRVGYAAQNVDVFSGSAAAVQEETSVMGAMDEDQVRNNAWLEAWGYRSQALNFEGQGEMEMLTSRAQARNTMLTAGMKAFGSGLKTAGAIAGGMK
jgi:hypothetical protein